MSLCFIFKTGTGNSDDPWLQLPITGYIYWTHEFSIGMEQICNISRYLKYWIFKMDKPKAKYSYRDKTYHREFCKVILQSVSPFIFVKEKNDSCVQLIQSAICLLPDINHMNFWKHKNCRERKLKIEVSCHISQRQGKPLGSHLP